LTILLAKYPICHAFSYHLGREIPLEKYIIDYLKALACYGEDKYNEDCSRPKKRVDRYLKPRIEKDVPNWDKGGDESSEKRRPEELDEDLVIIKIFQ
jgi:hypothetical protein